MAKNQQIDSAFIETIITLADDFEKTAYRVNESSIERKHNTEEAIGLLETIINTGNLFLKELKFASREGILLRNKHSFIFNTCKVLIMNLNEQKRLIGRLEKSSTLNKKNLIRLKDYNSSLNRVLQRGLTLLEKIIESGNRLSLLDSVIISLKTSQNKKNFKLKKDTAAVLRDTEAAIINSASNYQRGLDFVEKLKTVEGLTASGNKSGIMEIAEMAADGLKSAKIVNKSSVAQFRFSDRVLVAANQLHDEAFFIRKKAGEKYNLFYSALEPIAELAVLVAVELGEYLSVKEVFNPDRTNAAISESVDNSDLNELAACIYSACIEIESLAGLNYDMSENIAMNSRLETKTVDFTEHETEGYRSLKNSVEKMNDAARFPVEGSARNIKNAGSIERTLKKMAHRI